MNQGLQHYEYHGGDKAKAGLGEECDGEDTEAGKSGTEGLGQASMKSGEAIYKAEQEKSAAAQSGAEDSAEGVDGAGGDNGGDDKVVDADFEEVDDDKKSGTA